MNTLISSPDICRTWIRPMGNAWKLRVQGEMAAAWLCDKLVEAGLDCSAPAPVSVQDMFVFVCRSAEHHPAGYLERQLHRLPQVSVENGPA